MEGFSLILKGSNANDRSRLMRPMVDDNISFHRLVDAQRRIPTGSPSKVCHGVEERSGAHAVFRSEIEDGETTTMPILFLPSEQEAERIARELNEQLTQTAKVQSPTLEEEYAP